MAAASAARYDVIAMADEPQTIRCRTCGGVAHPASGCVYGQSFIVCGPCTREAWDWIRKHTSGKRRGREVPASGSFYESAGRHVR